MATRVQWRATVPAGADADVGFSIGSVPEGKKYVCCVCSYYGGDGGERYGINIIPAGLPVDGAIDALVGGMNWIYPMSGGTQGVVDPVNVFPALGYDRATIPGPCSLAISTTAASAAAFTVTMLGYFEDL